MSVFTPPVLAIEQMGDPVFVGVLLRSVAWAALAAMGLTMFSVWGVGVLLAGHGVPGWLAGLLGGVGAVALALLLFLPLAALIATLFIDRIAAAVERRHYPGLPPPVAASLTAQTWDGIALGARVLVVQLIALPLAIWLPGVGWILGWLVAAWAIGRGLFVAVAMRRMGRMAAQALYRERRWAVITQGGLMSAGSLIPLLNLLSPMLGTAAMVHVLHDQGGIVPEGGR